MATGGRVKPTDQEIQDLSEINDDSTPNERPFKKRKMATVEIGGDLTLTNTHIEDLAQIIVSKHMATIAIKYLGIHQETVENLRLDTQGDSIAFNRDVLVLWRNKNPGINQSQVSIFTARKRSLEQSNIFTCVCQEFCSQGGV